MTCYLGQWEYIYLQREYLLELLHGHVFNLCQCQV
jgi:hypothetical protein